MADSLPAVTGRQLIRLFRKDGWEETKRAAEGSFFRKAGPGGKTFTTVIPDKKRPLTPGTLSAMLGPKQSGIGCQGLSDLIKRHGP